MEVEEILIVLHNVRPEANFAASRDFVADALLDSFDIVVLVDELEARSGKKIPGDEILPDNFRSAQAIAALLRRAR